jgi:hypothetical protein
MTEETRKQIAHDALTWWHASNGPTEDPDGIMEDAFIDGAQHQDDIAEKRGYNMALNDVIEINKNIIQKITEKFEQCDSNDGRIGFASIIEAIEMHSEKLKEFIK